MSADVEQKKQENQQQQMMKDLQQLDLKLTQLKTLYEQYFLGLEKLEPVKLRKEAADIVKKYAGSVIQNTSVKFRHNSLIAKYNTLNNYWNRVLRELEEGVYKRDQFKKKLHEKEVQEQSGAVAKPAPKAAVPVASAPAAGKADAIGILLNHYLEARKKNNEPVGGITREALEKVVTTQSAAIKQQFNCKKVTFKVVTEGGKVKIKALPKKE